MSTKKNAAPPKSRQDLIFGLPTPQLDTVPEAMRPVCQIGMQLQSDALELWSHRARAWMDWPETFFACKTVDDLTKAQGEYLGQMQRDYAHFTDGMLRHIMVEQSMREGQDEAAAGNPRAPEEDTTLQKVAA
ncbi:MAG: hypothetical protein MPJ78_16385 [Hyphomicrobiaceae bacterium]|nr:hypothetical protein [Hyphomicrobiaceae bacterium]